MTEFQLDGKFQQISIDPTAHVELGQDVTLRSFVCLEVGNGATLKLGNRVFFNINCSITIIFNKECFPWSSYFR